MSTTCYHHSASSDCVCSRHRCVCRCPSCGCAVGGYGISGSGVHNPEEGPIRDPLNPEEGPIRDPLNPEEGPIRDPLNPEEGPIRDPLNPEEGPIRDPLNPHSAGGAGVGCRACGCLCLSCGDSCPPRPVESVCGTPWKSGAATPPPPRGRRALSGRLVLRFKASVPIFPGPTLEEARQDQIEILGPLLSLLERFQVKAGQVHRLVSEDPADYSDDTSRRPSPPRPLSELEARARGSDLPPLRSLGSYWSFTVPLLPEKQSRRELIVRLNELEVVDRAYSELEATNPDAVPNPFSRCQGYREGGPLGVGARWAFERGFRGAGIAFADVEQGWILDHEDLSLAVSTTGFGVNKTGPQVDDDDHGTAVLATVLGVDNELGVVGISPDSNLTGVYSHYFAVDGLNGNVAGAIVEAVRHLSPGDVLLVEVQRGFLPAEVEDEDFDAIRLASANGVIVVAAAGNGSEDLDNVRDAGGRAILNRASSSYRESGAILVGACESGAAHDRKLASNYGSRVDCFAWGEDVVTAGFGDLHGVASPQSSYTADFSNTSAASPMVAGVALVVQGAYEKATAGRLSPCEIRSLLSRADLGTLQGRCVHGFIGSMPDLERILRDGLGLSEAIYLRADLCDRGSVRRSATASISPDVLALPEGSSVDPGSLQSWDQGLADLEGDSACTKAGRVFVRLSNRGLQSSKSASAQVYVCEASTLLIPELWQGNCLGRTSPIKVAGSHGSAVTPALDWQAPGQLDCDHLAFVATVGSELEPAPDIPCRLGRDFDLRSFLAFFAHRGVASRNVHQLSLANGTAEARFAVNGTGDVPRTFHFEIERRLPEAVRASLRLPLELLAALRRGGSLRLKVDAAAGFVDLDLPPTALFSLCSIPLCGPLARRARLVLKSDAALEVSGCSLALRQMYLGTEIGRITWRIR